MSTTRGRPGAVVLHSDFRALAVVRSLGLRGIPTALVDGLPRSAWFSRYVTVRARWQGDMHGAAFVDFLLSLARSRGLEGWLLFPMYDDAVEAVAAQRAALGAVYRLTTPPWESVRSANDKRLAYRLAAEVGVPVPRTWYPAGLEELLSLDMSLPAVVKPANSSALQAAARLKALPARSRQELAAAYARAERLVGAGELMVQELIPGGGDTQLSAALFCREGVVLAAMTARRSRQYPVDFGLGSTFVEAVEVPELHPLAAALVGRLGLSGMVEVEFKRDPRDGRCKLLDVNVRAWGWHGLGRACGIDFPYLQYCETLGWPLPDCQVTYGRRWRRLLTDLPAALTEMRRGTLSPAVYARSFLAATERSVLDLRDPLPIAGDLAVAMWRLATGARPGRPAGKASAAQRPSPRAESPAGAPRACDLGETEVVP